MIVYLVRHGFSAANAAQLVTGTPTDVLLETGREQARALRTWLKETEVAPAAFWVSHWQRAQETAHLLYPEVEWTIDNRLGETDAGEAATLPIKTFLEKWPRFYESPTNIYPQGESHLALNLRVLAWWEELQHNAPTSALVVTHAGPVSCILQDVLGLEMTTFPALLPAHATVSIIETSPRTHRPQARPRLRGFSLGPVHNLSSVLGP